MLHIAGTAGRDADLAGAAFGGKFVDEDAFTREEAREASLEFCLHAHVGGHGGHGAGLDLQRLFARHLHGGIGVVGLAFDEVFEISLIGALG